MIDYGPGAILAAILLGAAAVLLLAMIAMGLYAAVNMWWWR